LAVRLVSLASWLRDSNRFRQAWRYGQRTSVHEGLTE